MSWSDLISAQIAANRTSLGHLNNYPRIRRAVSCFILSQSREIVNNWTVVRVEKNIFTVDINQYAVLVYCMIDDDDDDVSKVHKNSQARMSDSIQHTNSSNDVM